MACEVLGGQATGEPRRAEQDDVVGHLRSPWVGYGPKGTGGVSPERRVRVPRNGSAIPREISSRSASVNILRTLTVLLIGSVSPTIYTKINCYDRLGSSGPRHNIRIIEMRPGAR